MTISVGSKMSSLTYDNIESGETVYQRCVLLIGKCSSKSNEDFIGITSSELDATNSFPTQNWPISGGKYKALVILSPGQNFISISHYHENEVVQSTELKLNHVPLLQTPPLHLVIMIAKDSPLIIDCPPHKRGAISSAHSDLDAAIKKFRMTAYMWQALTAQDMYSKGLGRRSFRLEDEWTAETVMRDFSQVANESCISHMRSTAKIHLVRSEKTVAELRDLQVAQQNDCATRRDDLFDYFNHALKAYGGPFTSSTHPVVAGMVLDSAYSVQNDVILAHAALGCSNRNGISLGMFGSHLTYSWPRFLEEVPSCLLDTKYPGDMVGNDNGECGTMWEACSIGQGAFLHEVGHAFGAPHTSGIMLRGYAQHWPKNFLSRTAYCAHTGKSGEIVIDGETINDACWDLSDALSFMNYPHFWLPKDRKLEGSMFTSLPAVHIARHHIEQTPIGIEIVSPANIARIRFNGVEETEPTVKYQLSTINYTIEELENRFDKTETLKLEVLSMNGKTKVISNVWELFSKSSILRIPGSSIFLRKTSVVCNELEDNGDGDRQFWDWAVLLNEKGENGEVSRATSIDSRVGLCLDGAVIYFADRHKTHCGPRWDQSGEKHYFGGHASEDIQIPKGVDVVKVEVGLNDYELNGLRFHLSNGSYGGYLYDDSDKQTLEPVPGDKIIGFFGRSNWGQSFDSIVEFGILTAPKDVELPASLYTMAELKNTDGGNGPRPNHDEEDNWNSD